MTALRSFLRYLRHRGKVSSDLSGCVPAVPNWSLSTLPRFISTKDVERILKCCDRKSPVGRRNYAILLLARLGLRAGEVVGLNLDDIDWSAGQITIRGKGGRSVPLPLAVDVGAALAAYLHKDRKADAVLLHFLATSLNSELSVWVAGQFGEPSKRAPQAAMAGRRFSTTTPASATSRSAALDVAFIGEENF